jgi:hypothetical protein
MDNVEQARFKWVLPHEESGLTPRTRKFKHEIAICSGANGASAELQVRRSHIPDKFVDNMA